MGLLALFGIESSAVRRQRERTVFARINQSAPELACTAAYASALPLNKLVDFATLVLAALHGLELHAQDMRGPLFARAEALGRPVPHEVKAEINSENIAVLFSLLLALWPIVRSYLKSEQKTIGDRLLGTEGIFE